MGAAARAERSHMTVEEYLALPETMTRMEYVEGEVIVCPAPTEAHQELALRLAEVLRVWARTRRPMPRVSMSPLDVRFGPRRILQPDLCVWLAGRTDRNPGPITQIPDLCIEVLSDDQQYDRVAKRLMYADARVRELWAVDPVGAVERWTGDRLGTWHAVEGTLESELLPGFSLALAELFADLG